MKFQLLFFLSIIMVNSAFAETKETSTPVVVGWVERVRIHPGELLLEAKIAPDLASSSIHAKNISEKKKNNSSFVTFSISDREGNTKELTRKVRSVTRIRSSDDTISKRFVVRLGICMGDVYKEIDITLQDRSNLSSEMRIGRDYLSGNFLVDPSSTNIIESKCEVPKK